MRAVIAILCAAALVAGCGDDDDETTAGETTPATQAETSTVPPELGAEPPEDDAEEDGDREEPEDGDEPAPGAGRDDGAAQAPGGCGRVAFTQDTDAGASNIQAIGVDCRTARSVARGAADRSDDLSYELQGFSCNGARRDESPLARVEWICLRGEGDDALVSFFTS